MRVDLVDMTSEYIPLALLYLKSYAENDSLIAERCCISVFAPTNPENLEESCYEIAMRQPDVVGFSCYIWNMAHTAELCRRLRQALPDLTIVVGGPDVSSLPRKALENHSWIDVVVRGEGEETFRELLHYWAEHGDAFKGDRLHDIKGLAFRTYDGITLTEQRAFLENLDEIPSPYLNGCLELANEKRTILFETYRGCPFKCSFCYYPKDYGNLLHSFSLDRVEHDLRELLTSGIESIYLMDPTFNIPPKRAKEVLRIIASSRRSDVLSVTVELRVDLLDTEFMLLLKDAGISVVEVGLQSANENVLRAVNRKQNMEKLARNVSYLRSIGIEVVFQLIYGMPEETYESFLDALDFCVAQKATKIEAYRLQLLPGTPMYENASLLGLEFSDRGDREIISTRTMTKEDIDKAEQLTDLVDCFYNNKIARESFHWLARHVGTTYARLLDIFAAWRLTIAEPFTNWHKEGDRYLERFVRAFDLPDGDEVDNVVRNLKEYDHHTSPILPAMRATLVAFDYNIDNLLDGNGDLPSRQDTWFLFEESKHVHRNLFNGRFIEKPYRQIPEWLVFKNMETLDFALSDEEYAAIARWHRLHGDSALANTIARRLLERDPRSYEACYLLGIEALQDGQLARATSLLGHAAHTRPDIADHHLALANALYMQGRTGGAIRSFKEALTLQPNSVETNFNLAVTYAERGNLEAAVPHFQRVIELSPNFAPAFYGLGECFSRLGKLGDALTCQEQALKLWPGYQDAQDALDSIRAAHSKETAGTLPASPPLASPDGSRTSPI